MPSDRDCLSSSALSGKLSGNSDLRQRLGELAAVRRWFGYRRLGYLLAWEGLKPNHKKRLKLYREEGLKVRRRGGRRRTFDKTIRPQLGRGSFMLVEIAALRGCRHAPYPCCYNSHHSSAQGACHLSWIHSGKYVAQAAQPSHGLPVRELQLSVISVISRICQPSSTQKAAAP